MTKFSWTINGTLNKYLGFGFIYLIPTYHPFRRLNIGPVSEMTRPVIQSPSFITIYATLNTPKAWQLFHILRSLDLIGLPHFTVFGKFCLQQYELLFSSYIQHNNGHFMPGNLERHLTNERKYTIEYKKVYKEVDFFNWKFFSLLI